MYVGVAMLPGIDEHGMQLELRQVFFISVTVSVGVSLSAKLAQVEGEC